MVVHVLKGYDFTGCGKTQFKGKKCQGTTLVVPKEHRIRGGL
jgi:hypothetical protein